MRPTLPETLRLKITYRRVEDLQPYAGNARTHSDKQINQIAASMRTFGFTNPVLIDGTGSIVAGHGRVAAARRLGIDEVPVIELGHLSEAERRAYVIADNRLAELAGWDRDILAIELQALSDMELDFDLEITGFETAEIDLLLDEDGCGNLEPADDVLEPSPGPAITRPGDIWQLGRHKLICGDTLEAATYKEIMADERARAVFTDPPYNVKIDGHVCGPGKVTDVTTGDVLYPTGTVIVKMQDNGTASKTISPILSPLVCLPLPNSMIWIRCNQSALTSSTSILLLSTGSSDLGTSIRSKPNLAASLTRC